jgi:DNA-binding PadR family transcriptional regulator
MPPDSRGLARAEMAVLALLAERPSHGWALSREVTPGAEIGEIWSGDRQRVYRALRKLNELGLIEAALTEPGEGAHRTLYRPTAAGLKELDAWLVEPVKSLREAQGTFMLKLAFIQRSGRDPVPLLQAQRATVVAAMEELSRRSGGGATRRAHLALRLETARALLTVIDGLSNERALRTAPVPKTTGRRLRPARLPGQPVSDFTGATLGNEAETATVILRFGDTHRGIHVATAHVDDPIVETIVDAGQEASAPERIRRTGSD